MRLAIVGSRAKNWPAPRHRTAVKGLIEETIEFKQPDTIISGGADGVDTWAADAARHYGIPLVEHLPENYRWKPNGFRARNRKIVDDCTHMLCIRAKHASTYGSGWTADRAQESEKTVWRHRI